MSQTSSRIRTILPTSSRTALGATVATGLLTALASAPERISRLLRDRYPMVAVTGMTGVGKSQLVDRLTRRASDDGRGRGRLGGHGAPDPPRRPGCMASASSWCRATTPPRGSAPSTRSSTTSPSTA